MKLFLLVYCTLIILSCAGCGDSSSPSLNGSSTTNSFADSTVDTNCIDARLDFESSAIIQQVCTIVNRERAAVGVKPLTLSAGISNVAQVHAKDMVVRNYFSHTNPEGYSAGTRLKSAGISWSTWGENIAYYYKTPDAVMKAWMASSGHKANILNPKFGKIGIGYYQNYWVQDFTN